MALFIGFLVEAERLFAVRSVRNHRLGAAALQPLAKLGAVVGFVSEKFLGRFRPPDQALCWWAVVGLAAGQQEGKKTAFSICDCVDFRIAPAA